MKYQCVGPLIGPVNGLAAKWKVKRRCGRWSTSAMFKSSVTCSCRSPLPELRRFLHQGLIPRCFIFQRPLDSDVWIGEIKYRRVRTSKFLMRLTCRSLPGTLVFFNRCWGPTVRTNLQLNLCWDAGIRTLILRTKIWCGSHYTTSQVLYIVFNKTQVNKRQNLQ